MHKWRVFFNIPACLPNLLRSLFAQHIYQTLSKHRKYTNPGSRNVNWREGSGSRWEVKWLSCWKKATSDRFPVMKFTPSPNADCNIYSCQHKILSFPCSQGRDLPENGLMEEANSIRKFPGGVLLEEPSQQRQLRRCFLFLTNNLKEDGADHRKVMCCWGYNDWWSIKDMLWARTCQFSRTQSR